MREQSSKQGSEFAATKTRQSISHHDPADEPLVSIVVPVYNAEKFIRDTIKSVQNQTYQNWEMILVDDVSTDSSVDIIKSIQKNDDRIQLIESKQNRGAALSRNAGTDQAKGTFLAFLDADDLWAYTKLTDQVKFMQEGKHAFTFTEYMFADAEGKPTGKHVRTPPIISYREALKNHIIWTSTVMVDLEQVPKSVVYMPDVRRGQDMATWWQILRHTGVAYSIPEVLSYYRRSNGSLSSNKLKAMKRTWYLFRGVEKLSVPRSMYNFSWYAFNAVRKRV